MTRPRDHDYLPILKRDLADGKVSRRSFLRTATLLGLSAASAFYGRRITELKDETPKVPIILHFGRTDASIPPERVEEIGRLLEEATTPGTEAYARYQEIRREWQRKIEPLLEAIRASERITAEDLAIVINI